MELSDDVLRQLPPAYVTVLESVMRGDTDDVIAERLCVDLSAVPALVRLAAAKLLEAKSTRGGAVR